MSRLCDERPWARFSSSPAPYNGASTVLSLVVLAAGRGTRYGGSKQTSAVGPAGEWLLDYALFDAWRAGFSRAVLVVRPGAEAEFEDLRSRTRPRLDVRIVAQVTGLIPPEMECGPRQVPWGTAHAVLAARGAVDAAPFAVVNADDFYGREAYRRAAASAERARTEGTGTLVAMQLNRTLSPNGPVTRALCQVAGSRVVGLTEQTGLEQRDGRIVSASGAEVDPHALVSMNCWVLPGHVLEPLADCFRQFADLQESEGKEFLLPTAIAGLIADGRLLVEITEAPGPWFGLTHGADRPIVVGALRRLTDQGVYPSPLW